MGPLAVTCFANGGSREIVGTIVTASPHLRVEFREVLSAELAATDGLSLRLENVQVCAPAPRALDVTLSTVEHNIVAFRTSVDFYPIPALKDGKGQAGSFDVSLPMEILEAMRSGTRFVVTVKAQLPNRNETLKSAGGCYEIQAVKLKFE